MIMRYQRVSPDGLPSSTNNGRGGEINGSVNINGALKVPGFEGKGLSRFRSPSINHQDHISSTLDTNACGGGDTEKSHHQEEGSSQKGVGGDGLLQWGHRKRSRCSRNESGRIGGVMAVVTNDHDSSSSSSIQFLQRKQQRQAAVNVNRRSITNSIIPPPPPTTSNGIPRGSVLKSYSRDNSSVASPNRRNNLEDRAGGVSNASPTRSNGDIGNGGGRSVSCRSKVGGRRSSPSTLAEKFCRRNPSSAKEEKMNGGLCSSSSSLLQRREAIIVDSTTQQSEQVVVSNNTKDDDDNTIEGTIIAVGGGGAAEKANGSGGEANEWPKIFIPLSRKEKEEDFLVMKGTKLPHRPKKRPKTIDRVVQYCFPGMWLSDLTRGRYEVREKKCTKKQKRKGLKGMESVDSDSD